MRWPSPAPRSQSQTITPTPCARAGGGGSMPCDAVSNAHRHRAQQRRARQHMPQRRRAGRSCARFRCARGGGGGCHSAPTVWHEQGAHFRCNHVLDLALHEAVLLEPTQDAPARASRDQCARVRNAAERRCSHLHPCLCPPPPPPHTHTCTPGCACRSMTRPASWPQARSGARPGRRCRWPPGRGCTCRSPASCR